MGDNIYKKTPEENLQVRPFYQCPINSTHNTLIRHRSLLRESVMTELNCRVIEIVLSTLKYPVFMEIDMKGHEAKSTDAAGDAAVKKDCNPTEGICKIRHGFTGTSNLLDFLKTVCHAYSKCFERDLKPYPLILGFDVTGSSICDEGIFKEIDKLITNCKEATEIGKSLICGKTKDNVAQLSKTSLVTFFGDATRGDPAKLIETSPANFFKFNSTNKKKNLSADGLDGKSGNTTVNLDEGLNESSNSNDQGGKNNAECSEKKLIELMGKIILRCKGRTLIESLQTGHICHIDYKSSLKIQVNTFNKVKYPKLNYDSTETKLLRVYPGFNANIRALSYQKTISNEIKKRLNQLFNESKSSPAPGGNIPGSSSSAPKGVEYDLKTGKFVLELGDREDSEPTNPDSQKKKLKLSDLKPEIDGNITTCYGHDILKYINIASYNYPLKTEKDEQFQQLDDKFYSFYNGSDGERKTKYDGLVESLVTSPE